MCHTAFSAEWSGMVKVMLSSSVHVGPECVAWWNSHPTREGCSAATRFEALSASGFADFNIAAADVVVYLRYQSMTSLWDGTILPKSVKLPKNHTDHPTRWTQHLLCHRARRMDKTKRTPKKRTTAPVKDSSTTCTAEVATISNGR